MILSLGGLMSALSKIKERNKAKNKLSRCISVMNLLNFQTAKAEAQKPIRLAEQTYWKQFCSKINRYTNETLIWKCIKRMNRQSVNNKKFPTLKMNEKELFEDKEKADALSKFYYENGAQMDNGNGGDAIVFDIDTMKGEALDMVINEPFSIEELEKSLDINKKSTPGHDKVPYEVYNNFPPVGKDMLLKLFNIIWKSGVVPKACKHALFIPILKVDKDPHNVNSYRPISLLPCFIKIMERMVKERLNWFVEKHEILPPFQLGFRKGRSAMDNVVFLENIIQKNINNKSQVMTVFLDLEKAYDTLNIKGLLCKLEERGIKGRMLVFLHNYLTDRSYQVRINNQCSETKKLYT